RICELSPDDQNSPECVSATFEKYASEELKKSRFFWGAPESVRQAVLFSAMLRLENSDSVSGVSFESAFNLPHVGIVDLPDRVLDRGKKPESGIWLEIFDDSTQTSFYLDGVIEQVRTEANRVFNAAARRSRHPFSYFLDSHAGKLLCRSQNGEFERHRDYLPGDDPRFIDEKVYARTNQLMVRESRERQSPRVLFLADSEFLAEGYRDVVVRDNEPRPLHPSLKDFYIALFVAWQSRQEIWIAINSRGFNQESYEPRQVRSFLMPQAVSASPESRESYSVPPRTDYYFLYKRLSAALSAQSTFELENLLYGKQGFHSFGILSGGDTLLPRDSDILAFIHPRNMKASLPQLARLKGKGEVRVFGHGTLRL
ncbi:MAG: DUF58 domain-containing protein, partial [Bdellovibrionales bacterium]|nr:DUF58 domain-containing protein [Bdellovibrionales bacterium]